MKLLTYALMPLLLTLATTSSYGFIAGLSCLVMWLAGIGAAYTVFNEDAH